MPVRGLSSVRRKTKSVANNIADKRTQRALTKVLIVGAGFAAIMTPVDTSFLVNSQYRKVVFVGDGYTGMVGYTAKYSAAVHDPANPQKFKKVGAEKEFLTKGFEQNAAAINEIFAKEMQV